MPVHALVMHAIAHGFAAGSQGTGLGADVTFYGADQAGNPVQVTGSIGINFANYGDPS